MVGHDGLAKKNNKNTAFFYYDLARPLPSRTTEHIFL